MKFKFLNNEKNPSVAVVAVWYILSNVLLRGLGLITTPIFSRVLTKVEYGQFSNFIVWENLLTVILSLQLVATYPRAKYDYEGEENQYIASMLFTGNIAVILFWLIVEVCPHFFVELLGMELAYIRVLLVTILFAPAFSLWQMKFRMEQKYKLFVFFSVLSALISTIFSLILVLSMEDKFRARVYGYVLPLILLNGSLWIYTWIKSKRISTKYIFYALPIAIPLMLNSVSGNLLGNSDRVMITYFRGVEETAMYTMGYSISSITSLIWTSMNQAWAPWLYANLNKKNYGNIRSRSKIYISVFGILIIGVFLLAPEVLKILGGEAYDEAKYMMPPVIAGLFCQLIYGLFVNVETYMKKTYTIVIGTIIAALVNIGLNYIYVPQFGYIAAAYTTLVGYILLAIFHYFNVYKEKEYRRLYDGKFIFLWIMGALLLQFICLKLYEYDWMRYGIIGVYTIILLSVSYKKRLWFKEMIKG